MVAAISKELVMRKDYLNNSTIETIYFGGGTPSLLSKEELLKIFETIQQYFSVSSDAEVTLEANPDDLSKEYIKQLLETPVNRLSIGIQSFKEEDLQWMNRAHHADQALNCVQYAADAGFKNISIDLIYGIPGMTDQQWKANLETALQLPVQHLSCYCLTVEPKTALGHFVQKEYVKMPDDETSARQFNTLLNMASDGGFEHYEISNLCKPGFYSRHNTSYWKGIHYLGIGPSAHSFNGSSREWNAGNNALYIKSIEANNRMFEKEVLTDDNRYNEYIMVSLRTKWGIDISHIKSNFGEKYYQHLINTIKPFMETGELHEENSYLILSSKGKLIADRMASDLFI